MVYLFHLIHHIGYLRDPKDKEHLVVDEEAAKVIKRIFKEYLDGVNCHQIARQLNEDKIPTRIDHMKEVGVNIGKSKKPRIIKYKTEKGDTLNKLANKYHIYPIEIMQLNNILDFINKENKEKTIEEQELLEGHILDIPKKIIWDDGMVREILRNEMYTGYLALGKTENKSYKDRTKIRLPREKWIRVPNCHEAIIEREVWEKAKEKLLQNTNNARTIPKNLFSKVLYCSSCGRAMQKGRNIKDEDYYLSCRTVNKVGNFCDNRKNIRKSELENIVVSKINEQLDKYYDKQKIENQYNEILYSGKGKELEKLKLQLNNVEYAISEKTNRLNLLYEDRMNGILSFEEFKILKSNIDDEMVKLNNSRNELNNEITELEKEKNNSNFEKNELFEQYRKIDKLTSEVLNEFVEKIYMGTYNKITNSRDMKIIWNVDRKEEIV